MPSMQAPETSFAPFLHKSSRLKTIYPSQIRILKNLRRRSIKMRFSADSQESETMTNTFTNIDQLFSLLEGTWTGEGRGEFPSVTSFDYRETLTFTRRDEKTLAYEQRAQKRYDGQTEYLQSHWESGFIRSIENDELELTSAQIGRV